MDSIYRSKSRIRTKKMIRKQTDNEVNMYENNIYDNRRVNENQELDRTNVARNSLNTTVTYPQSYHPQGFNEIKTGKNGEETIFIDENFRPNELLLANTNLTPNINSQTKTVTHMTESSYSGCNDPTSQYKRMMILEMANSVISESNALFGNQREKECRPYEEQTEFQVSFAQNKRTQQIAKNIMNKYVPV